MADFTDKTFRETYRDFYNPEDGYHRVLFNSGRALQARELIESQTIIQEEIARFGRNIFKEGALVNPGGATVDNKLEYIRLSASSVVDSSWVGKTLSTEAMPGQGIELKILEIVDVTENDPTTLYVQYTDTSQVTDTTKAPRVSADEILYRVDNTQFTVVVDSDFVDPETSETIKAAGRGTKAYFASGDFFVQGHFVYMEGGSSFIDKYSALPTKDIGFKIEQCIVTTEDDIELFDNQGEVPNITAPGADRYQIKLVPTTRDQVSEEENFVFVARVVEGIITREVGTFDAYNRINDLLAQRTKEESGNYVVNEFKAIFEEKDLGNLNLDVTEGIAYVDGYRLEIGTTDINVPKARDSVEKTNEPVPAVYGNYIYIDGTTTEGFGRLDTFGQMELVDASDNDMGTCHVRGVQRDPKGIRLYIFNINMDSGKSFSNVVKLRDNVPSGDQDIIPVVTPAVLYEASNNNLLFPLPNSTPTKQLSPNQFTANYTAQRYFRGQPNTSGEIALTDGVESSQWIIATDSGAILSDVPTNNTYTGLDSATTYVIAYYVEFTNATARTKNSTDVTEIRTITSDDQTGRPIFTTKVDGIELQSVKWRVEGTTDWEDITHQFIFDGGQKDNYYDRIVIKLKPGYTIPYNSPQASEVEVKYSHYTHGQDGQFFSVSSYYTETYESIPDHTTATGQVISLRDVLDFRPSRSEQDLQEFNVTGELPQNASAVTVNQINYFLPRIDVLVANATDSRGDIGFGELQVIQGESNVIPREPEIPTGSMALYTFRLNPYTFNTADLTSTFIPNKRFTMKDIGKLEQRVTDLFELTTLSLLESNTNALTVLDENGNMRTKAGFIADNFSSFIFSDINNPEYRASIDPQGLLKPSFRENSVRLSYSTDNAAGVTKNGDVVTLPYSHEPLVEQLLATGKLNVNPFAVITQSGHMELSPSSDEWVETRTLPPIMQTAVRRLENFDADLWQRPGLRNGRNSNNFSNTGLFTTTPRNISFRETTRSIQDFIGEQVANVEVVPFMRSRRINFTVKGLRPNTKMFAYFGDKDVSSWVRQETTASRFSDDPTEIGSQYANETEYPSEFGGPTELQTDANGELIGSFFLPNTQTINFRTGTHEFKLLDVSGEGNDSEATSSTSANYTSTGTIESIQRTIRTTRVLGFRAGRQDPLAQTFFVDQIENPNGLFITRAKIFMESKDSTVPLQVQIRSVENGNPTTRIVPGAVKFIDPAHITVTPLDSISQDDTGMSTLVQDGGTIVEFDEPIYLTSGEEYCIVLLAESVEYNAYIAETYEFLVGSTDSKVTKQPTLGSLFLSQNGFTWTPDQTKDLMFTLDRAEFNSSGVLVLDNTSLPKVTLSSNPIETTIDTKVVRVYHEGHGFTHNDTVYISDVENSIGGIPSTDFDGTFTVLNPTWDGYSISVATTATSTAQGGGDNVTASQQVYYDEFVPQVQTLTPNATSITAELRNPSTISYGNGRAVNPASYAIPGPEAGKTVFLNDYNTNTSASVVASTDNANGLGTMTFELSLETQDTKVSPLVDLQRVSVLALENVIDNSDAAQHITVPIVIDEASAGLKIIFAANRPSGADFDVYVRSAIDEDTLSAVDSEGDLITSWVQATIDKELPSDDNTSTYRDYEYTIDVDQFTAFQVKIVMHSDSSSKVPVIRDLRAIALITGGSGNTGSSSGTSSGGTSSGGNGGNTSNDGNTNTGGESGETRDISSLLSQPLGPVTLESSPLGREYSGSNGFSPREARFSIELKIDGTFNVYTNNKGDITQQQLVSTGQWLDRALQIYDDGPDNSFTTYMERFGINSTLKSINGVDVPVDSDPNDPLMSHETTGVTVMRNRIIYDSVGDSYATNLSVSERGEMGRIGLILQETNMTSESESTAYSGTIEMEVYVGPTSSEAFGADLYEPAGGMTQTLTINYNFPVGTRISDEYPVISGVAMDNLPVSIGTSSDYTGIFSYEPEIVADLNNPPTFMQVTPIVIGDKALADGDQHTFRFITYGFDRPDASTTHYHPVTYTFGPEWSVSGPVTKNYREDFENTLTASTSGTYQVNMSSTHSGQTYDWLNVPIVILYTDNTLDENADSDNSSGGGSSTGGDSDDGTDVSQS